MGTALIPTQPEMLGVIPRAVTQLFDTILNLKKEANESGGIEPSFDINVQFVEVCFFTDYLCSRLLKEVHLVNCFQLYNEEFIDLLSSSRSSEIRIQEVPATGEIVVKNATSIPVSSSNDVLDALRTGARGRVTAATNMNQQSSRSHAIFSIYIKQDKFEVRLFRHCFR